MSLTANFDYAIELGIAEVRQIFHLAFKDEDRYPHNIVVDRVLSGRAMQFEVKVHDDESRPADLSFTDPKHIAFTFPFDMTVTIPDAPDPSLSRITMRAEVQIPALLSAWPEDGEDVLGLDFKDVTPGDVQILQLEGLPAIGEEQFRNAIHRAYDSAQHSYTQSGGTLVIYDGSRDLTLSPPNLATPFEITVALETHSGTEHLKVTLPIHVTIPIASGGSYASYGRIIFWRRVERTGTSISVFMAEEPVLPTLQTTVQLDTPSVSPDVELAAIRNAIHTAYDSATHQQVFAGNTLTLYDDARDVSLTPPNAATPYEITPVIEFHSSVEYLKVTLPIHVNVPTAGLYTSYGRIIIYRAITRSATTVSINFATVPADAALKTVVELDSGLAPVKALVISALQPMVDPALAGFGTVSATSGGSVPALLQPLAITAIAGFGTISEPAFSESEARARLQFEIAEFIKVRRFPVYSPKSGDETVPLSTPVGFLLPADGILAVLLNRRSGAADGSDDAAPDNFLGALQMALAVGRAKVDEIIAEAIDARFPHVRHGGTDPLETPEGSGTLKALNVAPADPGTHDQSIGHLWVTGEAEVHIDCWPDPDVSFSGPVFLRATPGTDAEGHCTLAIRGEAGDFEIGQSCCDVLIDLLIPIVGIVMLIVIEVMIDQVGGELAEQIAGEQGRRIEPVPPVVNGIAEVSSCLTDVFVSSQGFVFPGTMTIRRLGRSFDDLDESHDLPKP